MAHSRAELLLLCNGPELWAGAWSLWGRFLRYFWFSGVLA